MKKLVVIKTSLRKGSNSSILADEFIKGAKEKGHQVQEINLIDKQINFCKGCLSCQKSGKCIIKDDGNEFVSLVLQADSIVFATPIYYYEMAGQMKTVIDRLNPIYASDYKFKSVYLIATAAENERSSMDGAIKGVEGFVECFSGVSLEGIVYGVGASDPKQVLNNKKQLQEAYKMGYDC